MQSVYDYFKDQLAQAPRESTLKELSCDSNCGRDCCKVIDAAQALLTVCDPSNDVRLPILDGVNTAIEIYWVG